MNVEIVRFYPLERNDERKTIKGSLHVQFPELGINLRGIFVSRDSKDRWFFGMPNRKGRDHLTNEEVSFPVFSFIDREKSQEFMDYLHTKGIEFIVRCLEENPQSSLDNEMVAQETAAPMNQKTESKSVLAQQFFVPPKRPSTRKNSFSRGLK